MKDDVQDVFTFFSGFSTVKSHQTAGVTDKPCRRVGFAWDVIQRLWRLCPPVSWRLVGAPVGAREDTHRGIRIWNMLYGMVHGLTGGGTVAQQTPNSVSWHDVRRAW